MQQSTILFPQLSGATYSPCGKYRYTLWRQWEPDKAVATFVMLNPSTATELENDPTVERCQRRVVQLGYGGMRVVNIFALRSTDPQMLYRTDDPIGPENDAAILSSVKDAGIVIAAWGFHGEYMQRGKAVQLLLAAHGVRVHCLGVTKNTGMPRHPLYVSYATRPIPFVVQHGG